MSLSFLIILIILFLNFLFFLNNFDFFFSNNFFFDLASLYLLAICVIFFLILSHLISWTVNLVEIVCLTLSLNLGILCFVTNNVLIFWVSYELSIFFLLLLIYFSSVYSERFLAGWFLGGYLLSTGLPLLCMLLFTANIQNSLNINCWVNNNSFFSIFLIFVLFATKIPLPPFFAWLPVVHAEASTFVSILLSGFVMKLGIIGFFRFSVIISPLMNNISFYIMFFCFIFFLFSLFEGDNKRWLAYLSLAHILFPFIGFIFCSDYFIGSCIFFYCLCHGLSACFLFLLFGWMYNCAGSRNWILLSDFFKTNNFRLFIICFGMIGAASFPPSSSFFAEIELLFNNFINFEVLLIFFIYFFFSGLVPFLLIGLITINSTGLVINSNIDFIFYNIYIFIFLFWFFLGLLL